MTTTLLLPPSTSTTTTTYKIFTVSIPIYIKHVDSCFCYRFHLHVIFFVSSCCFHPDRIFFCVLPHILYKMNSSNEYLYKNEREVFIFDNAFTSHYCLLNIYTLRNFRIYMTFRILTLETSKER